MESLNVSLDLLNSFDNLLLEDSLTLLYLLKGAAMTGDQLVA
jgi:hypothetical protein